MIRPVLSGTHPSAALLDRYLAGATDLAADTLWALEHHLETCAACRDRLTAAVQRRDPAVVSLLIQVHNGLSSEVDRAAQMPARRRRLGARAARWATPALLPWLVMTAAAVLAAMGFDLAARAGGAPLPSLVLLIAPVVPLLGVAAAWSRRADPAHELVAAAPIAGLYLVLRRTVGVLAVVMPVLTIAGLLVGASPARWLLPCLAFTVAALALGQVVGLPRAAALLAALWAAAVVAPSLITATPSGVLREASQPGWAAAAVLATAVLLLRRTAYTTR